LWTTHAPHSILVMFGGNDLADYSAGSAHHARAAPLPACNAPPSLAPLFLPYFARRTGEAAILAGFDGVGRLVHWSESDGTSATSVHIGSAALREMMAHRTLTTAILAHNHPSGDARPSPADMSFTRDLAAMCRFCNVRLYDHLIFAGRDCFSFRRDGLI
jgi:DNA repair protein RadC